jgi:hypothetical protein
MGKRLFQVLDEMNQQDAEKGTKLVSVSPHFISGNKVKQGSHITMGSEQSTLIDLMEETHIAILVVIDKKEYFERIKQK